MSKLYDLHSQLIREARGEARGKAEGEARGKVEGMARLIVRQLTRRFGSIDISVTAQIQQLSITQLDDLGEALLDFSSLADLMGWLTRN